MITPSHPSHPSPPSPPSPISPTKMSSVFTECGICVPGPNRTYENALECPVHRDMVTTHCDEVNVISHQLSIIACRISTLHPDTVEEMRNNLLRMLRLIWQEIPNPTHGSKYAYECPPRELVQCEVTDDDCNEVTKVITQLLIIANRLCGLHPAAINKMQRWLICAFEQVHHVIA